MIEIKHEYWEHSGGTKFYEMVVFVDKAVDNAILVKRWGATSSKHGGGQVKIEGFNSEQAAFAEISKVIGSKKKRSASGQYETAPAPAGVFYVFARSTDLTKLPQLIKDHYVDKDRSRILNFFGLSGAACDEVDVKLLDGVEEEDAFDEAESRKRATTKKPEPKHEDWGVW